MGAITQFMASQLGMACELGTVYALVDLGFQVSWAANRRCSYDIVSDWRGCLHRIQIKADAKPKGQGYMLRTSRTARQIGYTKSDCDFILAPIPNEDVIYVIPVEALGAKTSAMLYPRHEDFQHSKWGRPVSFHYEVYKNNFDLLKTG